MGIRENSKKILERILNQAVKSGNLDVEIKVSYEELAAELDNKTVNYCKVCVQYLKQKNLIKVEPDKNSNSIFLMANVDAVDFLES